MDTTEPDADRAFQFIDIGEGYETHGNPHVLDDPSWQWCKYGTKYCVRKKLYCCYYKCIKGCPAKKKLYHEKKFMDDSTVIRLVALSEEPHNHPPPTSLPRKGRKIKVSKPKSNILMRNGSLRFLGEGTNVDLRVVQSNSNVAELCRVREVRIEEIDPAIELQRMQTENPALLNFASTITSQSQPYIFPPKCSSLSCENHQMLTTEHSYVTVLTGALECCQKKSLACGHETHKPCCSMHYYGDNCTSSVAQVRPDVIHSESVLDSRAEHEVQYGNVRKKRCGSHDSETSTKCKKVGADVDSGMPYSTAMSRGYPLGETNPDEQFGGFHAWSNPSMAQAPENVWAQADNARDMASDYQILSPLMPDTHDVNGCHKCQFEESTSQEGETFGYHTFTESSHVSEGVYDNGGETMDLLSRFVGTELPKLDIVDPLMEDATVLQLGDVSCQRTNISTISKDCGCKLELQEDIKHI